MANNSYSSDSKNQALARFALAKIEPQVAPFNLFATDFTDEFSPRGGTVNVIIPSSAGGMSWNKTSFGEGLLTASNANISLDHGIVEFTLDEYELNSGIRMEHVMEAAVNDLLTGFKEKINSLVTSSVFTNSFAAVSASAFTAATAKSAAATIAGSQNSKFLILNGSAYLNLFPNDTVGYQSINGQMKGAYGFNAIVQDDVWTKTGGVVHTDKIYGFAANRTGIAMASRKYIPSGGGKYYDTSTLTLSNGLTITVNTAYDVTKRKLIGSLDTWFGVSAGQVSGLTIIKSP